MAYTTKQSVMITVDGNLSDWTTAQLIDNPGNYVPGYNLYGTVANDTYYIAIQATSVNDPVIGAGTTIWLNTDQNNATGYSPFDSIGAEYNITYIGGSFYLYTGAAAQNLVSYTPLTAALSPDGQSLEIAVPRSLLTPAGGTAPTNINVDAQIDTGTPQAVYLPSDYTNPEYTITDPATLQNVAPTHKVAIVYSDTTANNYFSQTAYSDLFMAAQNQARMAGVSYDVIDESKLTNINNLLGYDAIIFPSMSDVNTAQLPAIMSTLTSAVYNYHIGIITSGDFLTNDQTGAPLPGNSYANMETLLGLTRYTGGNSGNVTVTANDVSNPIMQSYTAGQTIQTYSNEGYAAYQGVNTPTDVLVNQNVQNVGTLPGVVETTTGGTNVHFATTDLLGDSNLLSNAIQATVLGTQPGVALDMSRDAGVVAVRMDMDQSQFPADVSPAGGGPGIYDQLLPILQQWNQAYGFVGSFYVNIGDDPTGASQSWTNWAVSLPYYQAIQAMGNEIGTHSYTHLINPPTVTFTAKTVGDTPAGATQITLDSVPSFAGTTVGLQVNGLNIGTNTPLPGTAGEEGFVADTQITGVSGNTISISYIPGGYGTANDGTLGDIPAGTTLTFEIPAENTNFLQTGSGSVTSAAGQPFTYDYQFNQSKALLQSELGTTIYGAAIPGANETYATDQNIVPYFQSVAPSGTSPGYTGYVTGGWTGVGSGYPSAFGYMSPSSTDQNAVYLAPNMTFDFTEIQYEGKTLAQAEADWNAQFASLSANAAGTPIIELPIHDYGVAQWNTTTDTNSGSPYSTQMYTDFLATAAANGYEFVTLEDLASRIAAQQKANINYTTSGDTITATVTPDPTAPDVGEMALKVINGGSQVIQNVSNWYAYSATELFLPRDGGTFTVNLGTTQDLVTHIASLPMRADLLSVNGDGTNLNFSAVGDGEVVVDLQRTGIATVTGATVVSQNGYQLTLQLTGLGQHDVAIVDPPPGPAEAVSTVAFSADSGASATDFVTNIAAQTISGTLTASLVAGDLVRISLDNGATWQTATAAAGSTGFSLAGVTLTGSNTLVAEVVNSVGVASAPLTQAYVLDQTPPAAPAEPDLTAGSDTGVSSTDNITNDNTPTFTGTAEPNSTVTLFDGTLAMATGVAAGGSWTITAPTLADGTHNITATATDLAGNVSPLSAALLVTIDTTPPALAFTDGSTTSVTGTGDPGATVSLLSASTIVSKAVVNASGNWSMSFIAGQSEQVFSAVETDIPGNVSASSGLVLIGTKQSDTLTSTTGNDLLIGGGGKDTFVFAALSGNDIIADFSTGHDTIDFHDISGLNNFASVTSHTTQVGSNAMISLGGDNTLQLNNINVHSLKSANFTFA